MKRLLTSGVVCALVIGATAITTSSAATAVPTVTPFPGTPDIGGHSVFDLASVGYVQTEFLMDGVASAFGSSSALTADGRWSVEPSSTAPYRTRIVVNRPIDEDEFNGTVVVEWFNVSGNRDTGPDWQHTHVELIRRGYAWVGVSAQFAGVNRMLTDPALSPRYGPSGANLAHPGDSFSYDIFSQAGQLVRALPEVTLGGFEPDVLIAAGESQSAGRLVTYFNALQPLHDVYDGYFVHSRNAAGAPLQQAPLTPIATPSPTFLRDDLDVPVVVFQAENDTGGVAARQLDSDGPLGRYRLYEVAGTAHFDDYGLALAGTDTGRRSSVVEWFESMQHPTTQPVPQLPPCSSPINTGPATFVARAAISHLNRWIVEEVPPPSAPRLETTSLAPVAYAEDANGNVRGGVRTPAVDAAIARLRGQGNTGGGFCGLFGLTQPFADQVLAGLYGDHDGFVAAWNDATRRAFAAGFLVKEDAVQMRAVAAGSVVLR